MPRWSYVGSDPRADRTFKRSVRGADPTLFPNDKLDFEEPIPIEFIQQFERRILWSTL